MAYPARGRDPFLDAGTQAFIEKRGREIIGLMLIVAGVFLALMIGSYSSEDAAWLVSGDASVNNWMGRTGATIAAPLVKILGFGSWALPLVSIAWGVRMVLHNGLDRMFNRVMYAPIFMAVYAIYCATLTPDASWLHTFSMGGQFGDTVLLLLVKVVPGSAGFGVNLLSVIFGVLTFALGLFVCGVTLREMQWAFGRICLWGSALVAGGVALFAAGRKIDTGSIFARSEPTDPFQTSEQRIEPNFDEQKQRVAQIVRERAQPVEPVQDAPMDFDVVEEFAEEKPKSVFAKIPAMPSLLRREPAVAQDDQDPFAAREVQAAAPAYDDRIKARIASAIEARTGFTEEEPAPRVEPQLTRKPGPRPMVLADVQPEAIVDTPPSAPMADAPMQVVEDNIFADDTAFDDMAPVTEAPMAYPMAPMSEPVVQDTQTFEEEPKVLVRPRNEKPLAQSSQAKAEAQPTLALEPKPKAAYESPELSLLMNPSRVERHVLSNEALEENAKMLEVVLDDYGVKGEIVSVRPGPVVTMYELEPAPGLKASRVIGLADDIARSMSALAARVSTVPGRSVIGIELPNENREIIALREILATRDFGDGNQALPLALGKDIGGAPIVANLAKMPHLLIAGTTGSGKSVAINTMILSLLYKLSPDECRMIMIDPKMLELSVYDGIPHLLSPVVTDPKKAVVALKWVVGEMEDRYRKMSKMGVRNIDGYNSRVKDALGKGELFSRTVQTGFDDETGEPLFETEEFAPEVLPYIVVVVDEMADLMMVAGKEIEACIQRLAQMARASGIHLIMATQRPSVDVITGTIKANFPTRISFQVTSKVDSRTILGEMGAEQLLGMGDMLYMAGGGKITRVHGPFCSDEEVEEVVNHLKAYGPPEYLSGVVDGPSEDKESNIDAVLGLGGNTDSEDALYDTAVQIVIKDRKCSTSYIQRKLAIGYNKAARLVEQMEDNGLVSAANHVGKREILVPEQG